LKHTSETLGLFPDKRFMILDYCINFIIRKYFWKSKKSFNNNFVWKCILLVF